MFAYSGLAQVHPDYADDVLAAWQQLLNPANGHVRSACGLKQEDRATNTESIIVFNVVLVEDGEDFIQKATDAAKAVHPKTDIFPVISVPMLTNDEATAERMFAYWSQL